MALIPSIQPGDWDQVDRNFKKLVKFYIGPDAVPQYTGLTLTGLTVNSLIYPDGNKLLTSLGVAANGQLPMGSTGATPVLAGLTGTANQLIVTNGAGSITLSTPQDIHTGASPTFVGLTLSGLTATRLMATGGSKEATSVADLTAWIAGTADHISVADDSDGTVTLDLDTNTQTLLGSFNCIFLEKLDFTITESGGTVTGTLEKADGGGDLTERFSDGYTVLDCTPAKTIDLTAYVGTNAVPKEVFIYILQSAKTVIVASNVDWPLDPELEHIKIAHLVLKSAATTGTDGGALMNQNHNDYAFDATGEGHLQDIEHRLRQEPAQYHSGVALTLKNAAGAELTTTNSSTAVELVTATGHIFQIHQHNFPAFDMYTEATDKADIVNQPTDEGGNYETTVDLVSDVTHYVDGTAAGVAIGVNKYFNLVVWGVMNKSGEVSFLMINLPTGQYTTSGNAVADVDGTSVYEIPSAFKGTGFLIARLTFRLIAGSQWTYIAQEDLRGKFPDIIAGVGITTTDHALLANLTAPADDHTQYLLADGTRALAGAWDMGSQALTNVNIDTGNIDPAVTQTHDGNTLQLDGITSDGGAFSFSTTGTLTLESSGTPVVSVLSTKVEFAKPIHITDALGLHVGVEDTTSGLIQCFGGSAGTYGGRIYFQLNADKDDPLEFYYTRVKDDDLFIGDNVNGDRISILGGAGTVRLADGAVMATSAVPTTDPMIANKKYVDDSVSGIATWISLTDTDPVNYIGDAGKYVKVNVGEDGLEFGSPTPGSGDEYVNRGDPTAYDYTLGDFTTDATWRDWNLSAIVGSQTCLVHMVIRVEDDAVGSFFLIRENGNSDVYNKAAHITIVAEEPAFEDVWVLTDSNGIVEYLGHNTTFTSIDVVIRGWFIPAGTSNGKAKIDSGATADYLGAAFNDGVLRTGAGLSYADGGNFITLTADVGIADDKIMQVDDADAADNDYAKFTANGLEGRSYAEVLGDLSAQAAAAFDLNGQDLTNGGVLFLTEQAAAEANIAGKGQFWVKTATPNEPYFDNDVGTEIPLDNRYVDRGDPVATDWDEGDLTADGTYYDLDLSGIVPSNAVVINILGRVEDDVVDVSMSLRKNGNVNTGASTVIKTLIADKSNYQTMIVACDTNQVIEYRLSNNVFTRARITILGWWLA